MASIAPEIDIDHLKTGWPSGRIFNYQSNYKNLAGIIRVYGANTMKSFRLMAAGFLGLSLMPFAAFSVPVVDAGPDQTIYLGQSAQLHGTATLTDGDPGPIVDWEWNVISAPSGSVYDLAFANTADPNFTTASTIDSLGGYIITARAASYLGYSEPDAVVIEVIENLDPVAVISAVPTSGVNPLTVTFDGSGSYDPLGDDLLFDWNFDDGSGSSSPVITHTYDAPGTYYAVLTVVDPLGLADFTTVEINVSAVPVPPAVWLFGSGLIGLIGVARRKSA
jgi:hypothetical protein